MGKKAKAHRAKVAKRNRRIAQEKSSMQKAFDKLLNEQIEKLKMGDGLNVDLSGSTLPFQVFDKEELDSIAKFKENHPEIIMDGNEIEMENIGINVEQIEEEEK